MKFTRRSWLLCAGSSFALIARSDAKDGVRVVSISKIDAAKARLREAGATDWVTEPELKKINEEKRGQKQQLVFFEYHIGRDKWRGVYTDKALFRGFSWWIIYGENEMEAKVNEEVGKGMEPAFIARSGNYYAMLFVTPEQYADARKALDDLGVGAPKIKK